MKSDKDVIAELLAIIRLLIQGSQDAALVARVASLESWRTQMEEIWPKNEVK